MNGIFPEKESPAAMPAMFCSAMPTWMNLSLNSVANLPIFTEFFRSAASTTTLGFCFPSSKSASPKLSL